MMLAMERLSARRSVIAALLIAISLVGCREVARRAFTAPTVVLRDVRVRNVGLTGAGLDVYLAIRNPNPYALTATGATYRLLVNDSVEVGRGATTDTATAAAHDSTVVRLPLDVQWRGLGAAGMDAITSGAVGYRVIGSVTVATPVGGYDVPIDARGHVQPRRGS